MQTYLVRIRKLVVSSFKKIRLALLATIFTAAQIGVVHLSHAQGTGAQIQYDTSYDILSPVRATNGSVSSEQVLASQVGLDV